ncbi:putative B3 domain-containing protein At4g03170 [Dioscorea cayenensis subsp. rotundata]|uniref:B3 domain-containing protein At4g03170 n=1 Tax=Dioscorea cayennensis subsp. rotundata TaxID=55577 RepID=A0AB40ALR6_DIOCR|nr:putative B3 domain-containing protein At4g03170 [Dioscorea cayenensis subsp. rotundata]
MSSDPSRQNWILPSSLQSHMKRKPFSRKLRTHFKAKEFSNPYNKLEVLLVMTEKRLKRLKEETIQEERMQQQQQQQQQQQEVVIQPVENEVRELQQDRVENINEVVEHQHEEHPPPEWIVNVIKNIGGENLKLLFKKELTRSDVESQQNRLLPSKADMNYEVIPYLTEQERVNLGNEVVMRVRVIDSSGRDYEMRMRYYKSLTGHRIIGSDWRNFLVNNELKAGQHVVCVWGFRVHGELCFAMDHAVISGCMDYRL